LGLLKKHCLMSPVVTHFVPWKQSLSELHKVPEWWMLSVEPPANPNQTGSLHKLRKLIVLLAVTVLATTAAANCLIFNTKPI
jgi:hypothetical protein